MPTIRVVSYNIHKGFSVGNAMFVLPELARALTTLEADIIFLQETVGENQKRRRRRKTWPAVSQAEYLAGDSFSHVVYGRNASYQHGHHGNAILSKHRIKRWQNLDVSTNWLESRGVLHCVIDLDGIEVHLLNSHLSLFERGRRHQVRMIVNHIRDDVPRYAPLLLAGDFNDWRKTAGRSLETTLGVRDAFSSVRGAYARTFPALFPFLSLDHIFFSRMHCLNAFTQSGFPWLSFSDHLPVVAEFSLERRAPGPSLPAL